MSICIEEAIASVYYEPFNDIVQDIVSEVLFPGGRHSGKSIFIARILVALLCSDCNQNSHIAVFRKHKEDVRDSVYAEIEAAIHYFGLERLFEFKKTPLQIVRKDTRQTIYFYGLDDPRKHKSKKPPFGYVRWMWFEELDEFTSWDEIESVMISYQRGGSSFQAFFSFNPPRSSANWTNVLVSQRKPGRKVYHTDYRDLIEKGWISKQTLEKILYAKENNYENYKHIYLGVATGTGGEIFTNVKDMSISDEMIESFSNKNYGMDFGIVNDPTVLEGVYYDSDRDWIYCFEEWSKKHPFYTDIHEMLVKRKLNEREVIADTAPAGWIQNINMLGAKLKGCYKAEDWVESGILWMRSRTKIICDSERCPLLWRELSTYEYDFYKDGTVKEKLPDRNNHGIDAMRYALEFYIKNSLCKKYVGKPRGYARRF